MEPDAAKGTGTCFVSSHREKKQSFALKSVPILSTKNFEGGIEVIRFESRGR